MTQGDPGLRQRPVEPDDRPFLERLFASVRGEQFAILPLEEHQLGALLAQQFHAQSASYEALPDQDFRLVELDGHPIGRLYLAEVDGTTRIVDIALLPAHRGHGLGTRLLSEVIESADRAGRAVTLHVERHNPARHLYARLGFHEVAQTDIYLLLEHSADRLRSDGVGEPPRR